MQLKYILGLLALVALASAAYSEDQRNMRPIIGILTQPYQRDDSPYSYIAASYVKVRAQASETLCYWKILFMTAKCLMEGLETV